MEVELKIESFSNARKKRRRGTLLQQIRMCSALQIEVISVWAQQEEQKNAYLHEQKRHGGGVFHLYILLCMYRKM